MDTVLFCINFQTIRYYDALQLLKTPIYNLTQRTLALETGLKKQENSKNTFVKMTAHIYSYLV